MFHFKQFSIRDDHSAMKIGTDGILLGAWMDIDEAKTALDIGTGSGVIALIGAQKNLNCRITALEVDTGAIKDALYNIEQSPWNKRVELVNSSLQDFHSDLPYDCILSNPPFFENSLTSAQGSRSKARHTNDLHYLDIFEFAKSHLKASGKLNLILPSDNARKSITEALTFGFFPSKICKVKPVPTKAPHRWLLEFQKTAVEPKITELIIETGIKRHDYTNEYIALCKAFYLHF